MFKKERLEEGEPDRQLIKKRLCINPKQSVSAKKNEPDITYLFEEERLEEEEPHGWVKKRLCIKPNPTHSLGFYKNPDFHHDAISANEQ